MSFKFEVRLDDLSHSATQGLIAHHLAGMHANSPACCVYALDIDKLRAPNVTFFSIWAVPTDESSSAGSAGGKSEEEEIAGICALKTMDNDQGEVKSMRVADRFLGKGVGRLMVSHLIEVARQRNMKSLWLETGSSPAFLPAISLYEKMGFKRCGPYGQYRDDPFSVFMTREI
eukprot:comp28857_c0_seq1/m.63247 comp28857_c0_seq1/g.63247  ORF comp28857_c0_seq1/g.63247 comp28857_c0_seq1/m.63247 type:complete len:173 (-) comp28857_c0_seq1:33-551(-)